MSKKVFVFSNYHPHKGFDMCWYTPADKKEYEARRGHKVEWEDLLGVPNAIAVRATTLRGLKRALTSAGANWGSFYIEDLAARAGLKF